MSQIGFGWSCTGVLGAALLLAACGSTSVNQAPVESRGTALTTIGAEATAVMPQPAQPLPGAENAGKPGYYTVKPGDVLIRIGLDHGQSWKDLARWNKLENPDLIEVGQVLRVAPPEGQAATAPAARPPAAVAAAPAAAATPGQAEPAPAEPAQIPPAPPPAPAGSPQFSWPASGTVLAKFDEGRNKGVDIGGAAGEAVLASADGRVVYAGAGLRGYGNLVIVQHNKTYLTAYAHNQKLLVKEDQNVRRGQKIAEMGNTDADRVKLHFEIRREGKPVDPLRYLPAR
ncbi:peptidoglycan DD-metalloendopeptidase family protein [Comamonas flocculans]|uniref:Peptidoglycan DD-metalloendopeptidase family protein n=1 Tax=Comamonas flocculans TaxID=2597701 RepID=A0A5B8RZ01_9BURK|nr:peptidoglycan DD-metalloendopeptidase family protein [Comamonas flocculans]QEA13978.1 peptidoglycan DD-metalloendopeptidase family protein [Comamonas flocculans]